MRTERPLLLTVVFLSIRARCVVSGAEPRPPGSGAARVLCLRVEPAGGWTQRKPPGGGLLDGARKAARLAVKLLKYAESTADATAVPGRSFYIIRTISSRNFIAIAATAPLSQRRTVSSLHPNRCARRQSGTPYAQAVMMFASFCPSLR